MTGLPTARFEIVPRGPYSLAASISFLEGFGPAAYPGATAEHLHMAFVVDGSEDAVGVCLREQGTTVVGEVFGGGNVDAVRAQVERIMSLDVDGTGFSAIGQRDPVIGMLQARYAGLRPVCFFSPYEAAAWAIISHRIRIVQAARVKARMAEDLGSAVAIHAERWHAFPGPARLAQLESFPGLFGRKVEWLRAIAWAAAEGRLDAATLRALPTDQALARLKELPGIGDFSSQLILLRGAGAPDVLPTHEPRLARAVEMAYGLDHTPRTEEIAGIADAWRPYRSWACVLLRVMLEEATREIGGGAMAMHPRPRGRP